MRVEINSPSGNWIREITFQSGWKDKDQGGAHSMHLVLSLQRALTAIPVVVVLNINTGWYPDRTERNWDIIGTSKGHSHLWGWETYTTLPLYEGHEAWGRECRWWKGRVFISDWRDYDILAQFAGEGEDWIWQRMEEELVRVEAKVKAELAEQARFG